MKTFFKQTKRQVNKEGASLFLKKELLRTLFPEKTLKRIGSDVKKQLIQECIPLELTIVDAKDFIIFVNSKSILENSIQ